MKRYLVFAYYVYYPSGGWNDFISAHDTLDEAQKAADYAIGDEHRKATGWAYDDAHVVDLEELA